MSYFRYGFNMNYLPCSNMFGGYQGFMFAPRINPFMLGAINGYNSSMNNFFMMGMYNPMLSASIYAMPQRSCTNYPTCYFNFNFNFNNPASSNTEPTDFTDGNEEKKDKVSIDWNKAYEDLMKSLKSDKNSKAPSSVSTSTEVQKSNESLKSSKSSTLPETATTTETSTSTRIKTSSNSESTMSIKSKVSEVSTSVDSVKLKRNFSPEFINKTKEVARSLNCDWKDLMTLMQSESGIKPNEWNGNTAVGLIQFTDRSLAELKRVYGISLTKEQVSKMSDIEQLDLVEKYLKVAKSYSFSPSARLSAGDLYAITFLPGRASSEIFTRRGEIYYESNPLDENHDGVISKHDLEIRMNKKRLEVFV